MNPLDSTSVSPFLYSLGDFAFQLVRYFGAALGAYALVWVGRRFRERKLDSRPPREGQIRSEIRNSFLTMLLFSANAGFVYYLHERFGWFRIYDRVADHGWFYLAVSLPLVIVLHDAYFYWTHRIMHHPKLFRFFHRVHHQSSSPTPFTIYSFHPAEAQFESIFFPILATFLPIHTSVMIAFLVVTVAMNLVGHLGHELYGPRFWKSWVSKVMTSTTHHHLHHGSPRWNYGFYFRFWDRMMGTEDPRYEKLARIYAEGATYRDTSAASSEATASSRPRMVS